MNKIKKSLYTFMADYRLKGVFPLSGRKVYKLNRRKILIAKKSDFYDKYLVKNTLKCFFIF